MLYSETDRAAVKAELKKRRLITWLPSALIFAAAILSFVLYRMNRDESGWVLTSIITIVGGGYLIFMLGVYVHPVSLYRKHVGYMLDGHQRVTTGRLTQISEEPQDKDGLDCLSLMVNVGEKDLPEDDRLFYFDVLKGRPTMPVGSYVTVRSNDKMVSAIDLTQKES